MAKIETGDRVRYSTGFCRSIGAYTGDVPQARGKVTEVAQLGKTDLWLARVNWDTPDMPERVNVKNLERCR